MPNVDFARRRIQQLVDDLEPAGNRSSARDLSELIAPEQPETSDVAIEMREVVKDYVGGVRALDGVTIAVRRGQLVGLLGRNGAGKTTAIRILATLTAPTAGTASVDGFDVARQPA